jgi:hypothetical protein
MRLSANDLMKTLPEIEHEDLDKIWLGAVNANNRKIIVLDDDPTGTQTVHDVPVYTSWEQIDINNAFEDSRRYPLQWLLWGSGHHLYVAPGPARLDSEGV